MPIKIPMETLAELKRAIRPGVKITLTDTNVLTRVTNNDGRHKYMGITRTVTKAQTESFAMATDEQLAFGKAGSWQSYPKASMVKFYCDGVFKFLYEYHNSDHRDYFIYKLEA